MRVIEVYLKFMYEVYYHHIFIHFLTLVLRKGVICYCQLKEGRAVLF